MKLASREIDQRLAHFKDVAKNAGIKLTHQRLEIFKDVAGRDDHPDAEAVFQSVRRRVPTVSLDTVYRTLWLLNDLGLLTTVGVRRESVRFDAKTSPHHHYVCTRCGLTQDLDAGAFKDLDIPEAVEELGSVARAYVEVRGVCARCQGVA